MIYKELMDAQVNHYPESEEKRASDFHRFCQNDKQPGPLAGLALTQGIILPQVDSWGYCAMMAPLVHTRASLRSRWYHVCIGHNSKRRHSQVKQSQGYSDNQT